MRPSFRRRLNHRQVEAFMAVMEAGTVSAAAELMLITQPAVTRLVKELEHAIDLPLFARTKGRLVPTRESRIFYEEVKRSFLGLEKIMQTAEDIRDLRIGTLRIAALPAMALGFLPRMVKRLSDLYPQAKVSLQVRSSEKVMEWIASQQFDLGFAAIQHGHPAVEQELLLEAAFVAVLPSGHPLAERAELGPEDFAGETFVSLGPELGMSTRIDAVFTAANVTRRMTVDTQLSASVCALIAEGAGVSLVEPVTAAEFLDRGIVARPFRPVIPFRYSLLGPRFVPRSRLAEDFVRLVKEALAANPLLESPGRADGQGIA